MKQNYFLLLITLVTLTAFQYGYPQTEDKNGSVQFETDVLEVGTSAASFLEIGVGARAMAMGGAYTSVANDPTALYYNPAGAVWVNGMQVEVQHNEWLIDTQYDFVGVVVPMPSLNSALGLSFYTLGYGDAQPVRTAERPEGTGELWDARDFAVALTYSVALTDRFSFGLSGKYINQRIWNMSGSAIAVDLGIFYNTQIEGLRMGFSISNFGEDISLGGTSLATTVDPEPDAVGVNRVPAVYKTDASPLPLLFRVGISYETQLGEFGSILATVDINHPSNAPETVNIGAEYGFGGLFFIRGGYESLFDDDAINGMTIGGGLDYYFTGSGFGVRVDYAWADWGAFENSQRFSVGFVF